MKVIEKAIADLKRSQLDKANQQEQVDKLRRQVATILLENGVKSLRITSGHERYKIVFLPHPSVKCTYCSNRIGRWTGMEMNEEITFLQRILSPSQKHAGMALDSERHIS